MFAVRCPDRDGLVLMSLLDLEELRNTVSGIEVSYRCPGGERGTWLTGRGARRPHCQHRLKVDSFPPVVSWLPWWGFGHCVLSVGALARSRSLGR